MPRLSTPRMVPMPSVMFLPGMKVPGGENTLFMPVRALGAPHTTCTGSPDAGIDHADAQPVGIRMLLGLDHARDRERREAAAALSSIFSTSSPIMVSLSAIAVERLVGVEMLLEPGEGEFHEAVSTLALHLHQHAGEG